MIDEMFLCYVLLLRC